MAHQHVLTFVVDHGAWLTIDHPERQDAFDHETLESLAAAVSRCGDDASIGAVSITRA
jgi:enoyl-CoA hydratase/carnithine racemase